jgi:hypothetical protein
VPLSVVLERLTRDWLRQRKEQDEEEQERLRAKVLAVVAGSFKGPGISATNAEVRRVMGQQLMKKYRASQRRAQRRSD